MGIQASRQCVYRTLQKKLKSSLREQLRRMGKMKNLDRVEYLERYRQCDIASANGASYLDAGIQDV